MYYVICILYYAVKNITGVITKNAGIIAYSISGHINVQAPATEPQSLMHHYPSPADQDLQTQKPRQCRIRICLCYHQRESNLFQIGWMSAWEYLVLQATSQLGLVCGKARLQNEESIKSDSSTHLIQPEITMIKNLYKKQDCRDLELACEKLRKQCYSYKQS